MVHPVKPRPSACDFSCLVCGTRRQREPTEIWYGLVHLECGHRGEIGSTRALWGHEWAAVAWMATICDRAGMTPDFISRVIASFGMTPAEELAAWQEWADDAMRPR